MANKEALRELQNYPFPGNVRELENCVERFATMTRSNLIREVDIPCQTNQCLSSTLWQYQVKGEVIPIAPVAEISPPPPANRHEIEPGLSTERDQLINAMERSGWVQAKAARLLDMTPRQIAYRIQTLNIEVKQF